MLEHNDQLPLNGQLWGGDAARIVESLIMSAQVVKRGRGNAGQKRDKQRKYINVISSFDIETTSLPDIKQAFMYIWQWYFYNIDTGENVLIFGRTWDQWLECAETIYSVMHENHYMVVLDHNLSFEFSFLCGIYDFQPDEVFATDPRAVLKCSMYNHFEFRCTMRHSNTSLKHYLKQWSVEHQKLSGDEYNYKITRYPWSELSERELLYAFHDVVGLVEAYVAEMKYRGDNLYIIPMTSTGYVRRICKRAWATINYGDRRSWMPDRDVLLLLGEAFRGGDTHGSRFHSTPVSYGRAVINYNVSSYDRSSSYPDVLINCCYPLGNWYRMQTGKQWIGSEDIEKYIHKYEKCILTRVHFRGLRLRDNSWEMPYIPKSKCGYFENVTVDNGRIMSADFLSMTITDVDWTIIQDEYIWDAVYFSDTWYCRSRRLPEAFTNVVKSFFEDKTRLKNSEPGTNDAVDYVLKKQLLNSLFGMAAQHVLKQSIVYIGDPGHGMYMDAIDYDLMTRDECKYFSEQEKIEYRRKCEQEIIDRHNKNAFLPYSVGVWCTAWARLELWRAMKTVRSQGGRVLYCDTDSVKYTGNVDFSELNEYYKMRSLASGGYADDRNGKRHYMGVYEHEYTAKRFAHMGAKKYIYETEPNPNGKTFSEKTGFHLTVAGVNKEKGAEELYNMGGFDAWHGGTVFKLAGGVQGVYNDNDYGDLEIDGHILHIGRNVCLLEDSYTLGESEDYRRLLDYLILNGQIDGETLGGGEE